MKNRSSLPRRSRFVQLLALKGVAVIDGSDVKKSGKKRYFWTQVSVYLARYSTEQVVPVRFDSMGGDCLFFIRQVYMSASNAKSDSAQKSESFDSAGHDEFLRLYSAYQRNVYAYISTLLPNAGDVDDVLQETSIVLWKKFST